jgi:hypothetical protein
MGGNILSVLLEIEKLTLEQRGLISSDDKTKLEANLRLKKDLIQTLEDMNVSDPGDGVRAVLERIADAERENIKAARDEMELLRGSMKKAQEGMVTVRGYEKIISDADSLYMDKKR